MQSKEYLKCKKVLKSLQETLEKTREAKLEQKELLEETSTKRQQLLRANGRTDSDEFRSLTTKVNEADTEYGASLRVEKEVLQSIGEKEKERNILELNDLKTSEIRLQGELTKINKAYIDEQAIIVGLREKATKVKTRLGINQRRQRGLEKLRRSNRE